MSECKFETGMVAWSREYGPVKIERVDPNNVNEFMSVSGSFLNAKGEKHETGDLWYWCPDGRENTIDDIPDLILYDDLDPSTYTGYRAQKEILSFCSPGPVVFEPFSPSPFGRQEGGSHYASMGIQPAEFCWENLSLEAYRGAMRWNVQKYVWRQKEGERPVEALKKAQHYLEMWIARELDAEARGGNETV